MAKVKYYDLGDQERRELLNDLCSMVVSLKSKQEAKQFMMDLLTPSEAVMISRRIKIAKLLMQGSTYEDIRDELAVGNSTILQVDRWLNEGFGGYKNAIKKQKNKKGQAKINEGGLPFSLDHLRKKYPAHFLLINLLKRDS